jgi:hypothetical protein
MSVDLAISNEGARAGVLTRIDFANVASVGWPEFAVTTVESDYWVPTIADAGDGRPLGLPSTLAPGGIETVRISFKLKGAIYEAAHVTPQPNLTPLAVGLFNLREVRLEARVQYRRAALFGSRGPTETLETLTFDGQQYRDPACAHWEAAGRSSLVKVAHGGPAG